MVIFELLKRIFKKDKVKMLQEPTMIVHNNESSKFLEEIRVNISKKAGIKTLVCYGDGLGIQGKLKS